MLIFSQDDKSLHGYNVDQRVDLFLKEVDRQVSVSFAPRYEDLIPIRYCLPCMYTNTCKKVEAFERYVTHKQ